MNNRFHLPSALFALALGAMSIATMAEEPNMATSSAKQTAEVQIDRDGKQVCGWNLMSESERGGYKNIMHQSKELADRDAIRADHCARMRARAKERGVPAEE
jgi:hypothetical protein